MAKTREQQLVDFGRAIKQWREEKGLSRKELAVFVGVSKVSITHIENGRNLPRVERFGVFADVLGVERSALLAAVEADSPEVVNAN